MREFTIKDAHAVHTAMIEAKALATERREKMPTSSDAIARQAEDLKEVRDKILDELPESVQRNYR